MPTPFILLMQLISNNNVFIYYLMIKYGPNSNPRKPAGRQLNNKSIKAKTGQKELGTYPWLPLKVIEIVFFFLSRVVTHE